MCLNLKSLPHKKQLFLMDLSNVGATLFPHGARPLSLYFMVDPQVLTVSKIASYVWKEAVRSTGLCFPGLLRSHSDSWVYD